MENNISTQVLRKLIGMLPFFLFTFLPLSAQNPSWSKKAANAVFTLKTFGDDGQLLGSSNGFFIGENGEAVSSFSPFKNARHAVVIDAQDKEWPVTYLLGANDMYDVAKFRVDVKKPTILPLATGGNTQETVWLLPYSAKKAPACIQGTISSSEQVLEKYPYYTLDMKTQEQQVGCPVLNENGEVVGILQPSADYSKSVSYAIGTRFADDLRISGLSINDPMFRMSHIAKALPDDFNDALLSLYVSGSTMDAEQYKDYVERFIQKFPDASDGYIYRARYHVNKDEFQQADDDMKQAVKVADKKDEAHFQYAQLIYQKEIYQSDKPFEAWSFDRALQESQEAYSINAQPAYRQQQAQIMYAQKKYEEAYRIYMELSQGALRNADNFYAAAQCKLQQGDRDATLALMDSAVNQFTKPYVKTAAPYLLARAQLLYEAGKYRPAVNDYNDYEQLMTAQLTDAFYYQREQAEMGGHLYQQALNDIGRAIELAPQEAAYYAEKASVQLRVGHTDDAIQTAQECIRLRPEMSDGYLLLGLGQCVKGKKAEGLQNLTKAKELGNDQAQTLIDKYAAK